MAAEQTPTLEIPVLQSTVPVSFHFTGARRDDEVLITGSFTKWTDHLKMVLESQGGHHVIFTRVIDLPVGIHSYKFLINGKWQCANDQAMITDQTGNVNNVISVTVPTPSSAASVSAFPHVTEATQPKTREILVNQFLLTGVSSKSRGATPTAAKPSNSNLQLSTERRLIVVMVGLPARGKSFISRKVARYLQWLGYHTKIFNIGSYRRELLGSHHTHDFFRADNVEAQSARKKMALTALNELLEWLNRDDSHVAVFDGTNSTQERRHLIRDRVAEAEIQSGRSIKLIFVEVISNDQALIESNLLSSKLTSPDYVGIDPEQALADFRQRIKHYEAAYETIRDKRLSYIKIFEVGQETQTNRIFGYLPTRLVFFLMNLHISPRPIFLTRHGESIANTEDRVGGDTDLTERGKRFAKRLVEFMASPPGETFDPQRELCVWTSTLIRSIHTADGIACAQFVRWKAIDEIEAGICDGMTYSEIQEKMPEVHEGRTADKLRYRYPRGESYEDLIRRLEPVIIELERQMMPIVIVGHQAVLRCLYAYLNHRPFEDIPSIEIPLHTVIKLMPQAYGTLETRYVLNPDDE